MQARQLPQWSLAGVSTGNGSALIVFYSKDLEQTQAKIKAAGGSTIKSIFPFPGGRRFHFGDPNDPFVMILVTHHQNRAGMTRIITNGSLC